MTRDASPIANHQPVEATAAFSVFPAYEEDALYRRFKARLLADLPQEPRLLQLLASRPEIEVQIERPVIQADGQTLRGRLAGLIHDGFFDEPRAGNAAFEELKRRGFSTAKPNVYREADKLAELGFLTKEQGGYQKTPGCKIHVREK